MLRDFTDHRSWQSHQLPNGLEVLHVHDPAIQRYAFSVSVGAGHFYDPDDCQGLAHLLEHMLFLGSKSHPAPNQLHEHLSAFGGNVNAWTGTEYANFHFDCLAEGFKQALVLLADMLKAPLFDLNALDREINAIDAEFKLKRKDELRRLYQVHKETCNPAHPFSKFSVGNDTVFRSHSLSDLQGYLRRFHQRLYHAGNIKIAVISPAQNQQALNMLAAKFADLPSTPEAWQEPQYPQLYLSQDLGVQLNILPLKQARRMIVSFALPSVYGYYRSKPLNILSHLLGDETKGSLLDYLKKQGWASSLSAGGGIQGSNFKDFNINLQLSESGIAHTEDILGAIFSQIANIRDGIRQAWRFDEKATLSALALKFGEQHKPLDEVAQLSEHMFLYPTKHALVADYIMDRRDPEALNTLLACFTPDNMRVKLIAPELPTDREAQWYGTRYQIRPLPDALLDKLSCADSSLPLNLPDANPHIPTQLGLINPKTAYGTPVAMLQSEHQSLWFAQDFKFRQPKGDCFISFDCQAIEQGIGVVTYKRLWLACLMESLNERFYQASIAGLNFHVYSHQGGFSLHTSGFSEKQLDLAKELLVNIHKHNDFSASFDSVQKRQWQNLQNSLLNKPINRLFTRLSVLMQRHTYAPVDCLKIVEQATLDDVINAQQQLLSSYHVEGLVHGNWQAESADSFYSDLARTYTRQSNCSRNSRAVADLRSPHGYEHPVQSSDEHALVVYFQSPSASLEDVAKTILLEQLLATPFFNQLRTEQQLGYVVGSGYFPFNQHPGLAFYVQSPNYPVPHLLQAIRQFLQQSPARISQYAPIWENVKNSVCNQLVEKDASLAMKSQRLWSALGNDDVNFERQLQLVSTVQSIQLEHITDYTLALLSQDGFGRLILHNSDNLCEDWTQHAIQTTDLPAFKQTVSYIQ